MGSPGSLGWSNLNKPDDAFGELKFKADVHYDEDGQALFVIALDSKVIEPLWPKFLKEADKLDRTPPKGGWVKPDGAEWLEEALKQPKEKDRVQVPYLRFSNKAEYTKDGETRLKVMRVVGLQKDGTHILLDRELVGENKAKGSKIRPIIRAQIFSAPGIEKGRAMLSLQIQGVEIIKLEQRESSAGGDIEGLSDEELEALGTDFEAQDFSAYAAPKKASTEEPKKKPTWATPVDDLDGFDDDIPF